MKSKIFLLFFLISIFNPLYALSFGDFDFNLGIQTGTLFGRQGEYIYDSSDTYYCSYLEWNETPLYQIGVNGQASYKNLFASADFSYYLPLDCGMLYDSDYTETFKKNYAWLKNKSVLAVDFDFSLFYKIHLSESFNLMPYLQGMYDYRSFSTYKGYCRYGANAEEDVPWDDSTAVLKRASGIDFYRENYLLFCGLGFEYNYKNWNFSFISLISPFGKIRTIDYHRDENSNDVEEDYYVYEVQYENLERIKGIFKAEYKINNHFSVNGQLLLFAGQIVKGSMWSNYYRAESSTGIFASGDSDWKKLGQKCGASVIESTFSLGVTVR